MFGQHTMHSTWIGKAETAAAELSFDYFLLYILAVAAGCIVFCWCGIIQLQLYQMCPGWGPIRKFDSDGTEEMRINQLLIHEDRKGMSHAPKSSGANDHMAFLGGIVQQAHGEMNETLTKAKAAYDKGGIVAEEQAILEEGRRNEADGGVNQNGLYTGFQESYGSIGRCTWGYCEAPNQWGEPKYDPRYGEVVVRHGFADTQWMRKHSRTWARDEPYCLQQDGINMPPPSLEDESACQITQRMVIERGGY